MDASATQAAHYVHWLALTGFRNPGGALPFYAAAQRFVAPTLITQLAHKLDRFNGSDLEVVKIVELTGPLR